MGRKRVGGRRASRKSYTGRSRTCSGITQPGPFSSTTTVTGLPSTPSRNVMRQPQASRACVNPFNTSPIISAAARPRLGPLQERLDLFLERVLARETDVLAADLSLARDDDGHRKAEH